MKRFIFGVCFFILILIAAFFLSRDTSSTGKVTFPSVLVSPAITQLPIKTITKTLFVPYWTMNSSLESSGYDNLVYFGITADRNGIDTNEIGYKSIHNFMTLTTSHAKRLLGMRLLNTDVNTSILRDTAYQKRIIEQSIATAKQYGFDGIVLDFEISALGFDSITKNISSFEIGYADTVRKDNLVFYATIYGDAYARFRPFDVQNIASHTDGIMIMAYDFHKANGNPGPNFPLKDNQDEGYDFQTMVHDFLGQTTPGKITIVFGLYGYDWTVDEKGNPIGTAVSMSDYKIKQKFLNNCSFTDCRIIRDPIASETKITYIDADNKKHIVWFEDTHSIDQKINFLKSKGIDAIGYWAYSYF